MILRLLQSLDLHEKLPVNHHHHQVKLIARVSLTHTYTLSLSFSLSLSLSRALTAGPLDRISCLPRANENIFDG